MAKPQKLISKLLALYRRYEEVINYLIIGGLTTAISLLVKYALLFTVLDANNGLQLQVSVAVSWCAAVVFAYVTNRKIVFRSNNPHIFREFVSFISARLVTLGLESLTLWFFITLLGFSDDVQVIIWTIIAQIIVIVGNYILSKIFVFRRSDSSQ